MWREFNPLTSAGSNIGSAYDNFQKGNNIEGAVDLALIATSFLPGFTKQAPLILKKFKGPFKKEQLAFNKFITENENVLKAFSGDIAANVAWDKISEDNQDDYVKVINQLDMLNQLKSNGNSEILRLLDFHKNSEVHKFKE